MPVGDRRMSANPHANGGTQLVDLELPDFSDYGVEVRRPGVVMREATQSPRDLVARRHSGQSFEFQDLRSR